MRVGQVLPFAKDVAAWVAEESQALRGSSAKYEPAYPSVIDNLFCERA